MKSFSDLNITLDNVAFTGKKKDIEDVIGQEIVVHDYKIVPSKYLDKYDKCLHLQISIDGKMHVLFSGSKYLISFIEQVSKNDLPRKTIIIRKDKKLLFS